MTWRRWEVFSMFTAKIMLIFNALMLTFSAKVRPHCVVLSSKWIFNQKIKNMKNLVLLAIFCLSANLGISQEDQLDWRNAKTKSAKNEGISHAPAVKEGVMTMSEGAQSGFSVLLPNTNKKTVQKLWKELMKDYDSKPKKVKKTESVAAGARIASISGAGEIDVYSQLDEQGDDVAMTVWFDMGDGKWLNSRDYPNSYEDAERLIEKFGIKVKKTGVEQELESEEKYLKKTENELEKLVKKKEKLEKDIENYKKKIEKAEEDIEKNISAQEETKAAIEEQKMKVGEVNKRLDSFN